MIGSMTHNPGRWRCRRRSRPGLALSLAYGAALLLAVLSPGCSGGGSATGPTGPARPAPVTFDLALETEHFELRFGEASADLMDDYAAALEAAYPRVTAELGQSGLPRIKVRFYPDLESFRAATGWDAWGLIEGPNLFLMVASPFQPVIAVHEFAHCITLHLDRTFANNPTWLWEAVAVYEARDFIHPRSIPCLANRQFPSLSQLNQRGGPCDIYRVGYTLAEYIVDGWTLQGLRDLIVAHGDTREVLGLSAEEFEAGWQRFVEERYL